jgi:hypothetical protein
MSLEQRERGIHIGPYGGAGATEARFRDRVRPHRDNGLTPPGLDARGIGPG